MRKKIISILLAISLATGFSGCGYITKNTQISDDTLLASNTQEDTQSDAMGRYVEKTIELESYGASALKVLDDNSIMYASEDGVFKSTDNGDTWEDVTSQAFKDFLDKGYTLNIAIANDGTIAGQYNQSSDSDNIEDFKWNTYIVVITPDGESREVKPDFTEDESYAREMCFDDNGRLIATTYSNNIYEIDTTSGKLNTITTLSAYGMYIDCKENIILAVDKDGLFIYDTENNKFIEDEVLNKFVTENFESPQDYVYYYNFYTFLGEESTKDSIIIYLASDKGLYRHVVGGSSMELVIDSELSSFGNPSRQIRKAISIPNNEFIAEFSDDSIIKFYYDETVSTVPSNTLSVYSLEDNDTLRQAITTFQTNNPDMYVEYTIGLGDDGTTKDDALKKLSTQFAEGSGPDVIILDDLPIDSYVEKGVLMDMSDIIDEINSQDGLFTNLTEPFYQDDKIYAIPAEFQLPVIAGDSESVESVKDYDSLASAVETLRNNNPSGSIISRGTAYTILRSSLSTCASSWINEDGTVNEDNIRNFLGMTKKIYDAQLKGLSQKEIQSYASIDSELMSGNSEIDADYLINYVSPLSYAKGNTKLVTGNITSIEHLATLLSLNKDENLENTLIATLDGQSKNVYIPITIAGINANTANIEMAAEFVKELLSNDVQTLTYNGLPINKSAFELILTAHDDEYENDSDGVFAMYGQTDDDGTTFTWNVYWFDSEQKQLIRDWIAKADTPYLKDSMITDTVSEQGVYYLEGSKGLEEAVECIMQNIEIYLAE
jgi:ABC-type glycerol-3-phosphate transport system substrate-binding protein